MIKPGTTEGPGPLSALEHRVLLAMLKGEGPGFAILRDQLAGATMLSRTYSGVGLMTRIAIPEGKATVPASVPVPLRPVLASHPQLPEATEFLLQLREGRLATLEAYCFEGYWPLDERAFRIAG